MRTGSQRVVAPWLGLAIVAGLWFPRQSAAASTTITFEESIPQPAAVRSQYCNQAATNRGVLFADTVRVFRPTNAPASPVHAAYNDFRQEFDETRDVEISFTTGQSKVGMKVGLDRTWSFQVTALLTAYSSATPGRGFLTYSTAYLGYGPKAAVQDLSVSSGEGDIRSVVLEFTGPSIGNFAIEVFDDLYFTSIGPTCLTDTKAPTVQITTPAKDGEIVYPDTALEFTAQDAESGIAQIEVAFVDTDNKVAESFFVCGAGSAPACGIPGNTLHYDFLTHLPDETETIRVSVKDYAQHGAKAERDVSLRELGPNVNLYLMAMEITQGVQSWIASNNWTRQTGTPLELTYPGAPTAVPLVADRTTVVRLFAAVEGIASDRKLTNVLASLRCFRGPTYSTSCPGYHTLAPVKGQYLTLDPKASFLDLRDDLNDSFTFILPKSWTQEGTLYLEAEVRLPNPTVECVGCKDAANRLRVGKIQFNDVPDFNLLHYLGAVRHVLGNTTTVPSAARVKASLDYLRRTFPIDESTVPTQVNLTATFTDDASQELEDRCNAMYAFVAVSVPVFAGPIPVVAGPGKLVTCGLVPITFPCSGLGDGTAQHGGYCFARVNQADTAAHEIGHGFGLLHAGPPPGHGAECKSGWCDTDWPWPHGTISSYGFDVLDMSVKVPGITEADFHDLMSYGGPKLWISARNWIRLYNAFNSASLAYPVKSATASWSATSAEPGIAHPGSAWRQGARTIVGNTFRRDSGPSADPFHAASSGERSREIAPHLLVRGLYEEPSGWRLLPVYELPPQPILDDGAGDGEYEIQLRGPSGALVHRRRFSIERHHIDADRRQLLVAPPSFAMMVPALERATAVILYGEGARELARITRSEHSPVVAIESPDARGFTLSEGEPTIRWRSSDTDSERTLHHLVQYGSMPAGEQETVWRTLTIDLAATTLEVDPETLPGSEVARVRVLCSDGFNTGVGLSEPFRTPNHAPQMEILLPSRSTTIRQGEPLALRGTGWDLEDGLLAADRLTWESSRDGLLGKGRSLDLESLSLGEHQIVLRGRDSSGQTGQSEVAITVERGLETQPIADAGPDVTVEPPAFVRLNGFGSGDADGDRLFYRWSVVASPAGSVPRIIDPSAPDPTFTADLEGAYELELVVHDGRIGSVADRTRVLVKAPGWCCLRGQVFPVPAAECREQGGAFFDHPEQAERHCREETPPDG